MPSSAPESLLASPLSALSSLFGPTPVDRIAHKPSPGRKAEAVPGCRETVGVSPSRRETSSGTRSGPETRRVAAGSSQEFFEIDMKLTIGRWC
jgi:hypothetical protein